MTFWITNNVWLIPATPILASLLILGFGKPARFASSAVAVLGQIAALAMSILAFATTLHSNLFRVVHNFTWFTFGNQSLRIGFILDPLAAAEVRAGEAADRQQQQARIGDQQLAGVILLPEQRVDVAPAEALGAVAERALDAGSGDERVVGRSLAGHR